MHVLTLFLHLRVLDCGRQLWGTKHTFAFATEQTKKSVHWQESSSAPCHGYCAFTIPCVVCAYIYARAIGSEPYHSGVYGDYPEEVNAESGPIMTAISTVVDNSEGRTSATCVDSHGVLLRLAVSGGILRCHKLHSRTPSGDHYGAKLECPTWHPSLASFALPWENSAQSKEVMQPRVLVFDSKCI